MTRAHRLQPGYLKPVSVELELGGSCFTVSQGDRRADRLAWDEMIGQVIALTHPRIRMAHYPMLTEAERAVERARHELRMAELRLEGERKAVDPDFAEVGEAR